MEPKVAVAKHAQPHDPSAAIAALRLQLEELVQQAQQLADRYQKNTDIAGCLLFLQKALNSISDEDELGLDPGIKVDWVQFGKTLRDRRIQADLGQKELADLADISESMVRAIEAATKRPSRRTLLRLLAIAVLNLKLEDVLGDSRQDGVIPTLWLAPHYDPRQLITELVERLNGNGGSLEQTTAYLDYQSAADWLTTSNTPAYQAAYNNTSALEAAAERIAEQCGAGGVDVIALGCGDARREVKLVEYLTQYTKRRSIKDIRLFLLDISHMLITEGYHHAKEVLGGSIKNIVALHGNFHQLSQYPLFSSGDKRTRCRVFTLLGNTLSTLDNEVRFFRDNMNAAIPGDFFLADYTKAFAPPEDPERIRELDPPFSMGVLAKHKTWLEGPIYRYTKGVRAVDINIELTTDCLVRGSYEVMYVANVTLKKSLAKRRFVVFRFHRYDPAALEDCLARTGWATELRLPYGGDERSKLMLMLLRKTAESRS